jgi:hypothetical protein
VIVITGTGDHLRPEWPITITGMRSEVALPAGIAGIRFRQTLKNIVCGLMARQRQGGLSDAPAGIFA